MGDRGGRSPGFKAQTVADWSERRWVILQGEVAFAGNRPTPQFLRRFTRYVEQVRCACFPCCDVL